MNIKKRTHLLSALCLLSFAGSLGGFLLYATAGVFINTTRDLIDELNPRISGERISSSYLLVYSLLFAISFLGAAGMWRMKTEGFWLYFTAQLLIVSYPVAFFGKGAISSLECIFTLLFIALYASQLKNMRHHSLEK